MNIWKEIHNPQVKGFNCTIGRIFIISNQMNYEVSMKLKRCFILTKMVNNFINENLIKKINSIVISFLKATHSIIPLFSYFKVDWIYASLFDQTYYISHFIFHITSPDKNWPYRTKNKNAFTLLVLAHLNFFYSDAYLGP